jgi:hypothetical protein
MSGRGYSLRYIPLCVHTNSWLWTESVVDEKFSNIRRSWNIPPKQGMQESGCHFDVSPLRYTDQGRVAVGTYEVLTWVAGATAAASIADICKENVNYLSATAWSVFLTVRLYIFFRLVARMSAFRSASARRPGSTAEEENSVFKSRKAVLTLGVSCV